jgi:hypothetical protein
MTKIKVLIYFIIITSHFNFSSAYSLDNKIYYYKQISDDNHSTAMYSLNCESPKEGKNCALYALIVAGDRAKHSCSVTYQTIFKKKSLKIEKDQKFSIEVTRKKCNDSIKYIFDSKSILTHWKEFPQPYGQVGNNTCEQLKVFRKEGIGTTGTNLSRSEFQECKTLVVQMDD